MFQTLLCTCLSINAPCPCGNTCSHLHCFFVYQRDRACHAFASCTDCIAGMITFVRTPWASHVLTTRPMRQCVNCITTGNKCGHQLNYEPRFVRATWINDWISVTVADTIWVGVRRQICGPDFDIVICGTSCVWHQLVIGFRQLWLTLAGWVCVAMI